MVPAQRADEELFSRLGYLLSGDHERTARLVRSVGEQYRSSPGESPFELLVREWLDDPGVGYGRDDVPSLAALPPRRRAAVVLRHWAGLPVGEVARILQCVEAEVDEPGEWPAETMRAIAEEAVGVRRRHRLRSAAIAVGVLGVAGVFATMLSLGSPEPALEAEVPPTPSWTPAPRERVTLPPGSGAVVVDAQARKLTATLAEALEREFPQLSNLRAGPSGPLTGYTARAPMEFYTRAETHPPHTYFAQAIVDVRGEGVLVLLEVRKLGVDAAREWVPCRPEYERGCAYREYPDRTRADVEEFTDPASQGVVRRLTSLRADGTFTRVTAYGSPLREAELFGFARVFTW